MTSFTLTLLQESFAVCRLAASEPVPDWADGALCSIIRTPRELSIVCPSNNVPQGITCQSPWRCLRVDDKLDFSMVGVIASLTTTLAAASISVFVVSTFDTDYLFVSERDVTSTIQSLTAASHRISQEGQSPGFVV